MSTRPLALTQDDFSESYFQIGSGTCLQPLLRYSDQIRGFVFVDYSLDGDVFLENLRASQRALHRAASQLGVPRPLWLEDIQYQEDLTMADFELALSPAESIARYDGSVTVEKRKTFGGMVWELDSAVGAIADALRMRGMWGESLRAASLPALA